MTRRFRLGAIMPLILVTSLLTACGFQLRGQMDIASDIAQLAVSGGDRTYSRELRQALENAGIEITDSANYRLNILSVERQRGDRTQGSAGAYERLLTMTASYQLETIDGLLLFQPTEISSERYLSQHSNQINAARNEENIIFEELRRDLIMNTVRRVASISGEALRAEADRARKVRQMELEALESEQ